MSGLINKVKDALHHDKTDTSHDTHTTGSHTSGTHTTATHGSSTLGSSTGVGGYGSNTTHSGTHGIPGTTHGSSTTAAGPHSSNLANKADPRVDSDRDHRNDPTSQTGSYGGITGHSTTGHHGQQGSAPFYDSITTSSGTAPGSYGSTNAGPHGSNLANKLDPRVDSDRDNRNNPTSQTGGYGIQENYGVSGSNPAPTGSNQYSSHIGQHGTTGGYGSSGVAGQSGTLGGYGSSNTIGSGNGDRTAGAHSSNLLNKLDPRVDSDRDEFKTTGGNSTHY